VSDSRVVRSGAPTRFTGLVLLAMVTSLVLIAAACGGEAERDILAGSQPTPLDPSPAPSESVLRRAGEVLLFTGTEAPGDLVAVDPATGEERVLVEDLDDVYRARWSADGRWVAFGMAGSLWVVDRALEPRQVFLEPRQVFEGPGLWVWSSTGGRLAVILGSTLSVVDPSTGQTTELASTVGDVTSAPAWSPDGTRIVFGARGGSVYSIDVRTGERSLVVQLPGEHLDSIDGIEWSPDGSRLVIYNDLDPGDGRLFVLNPDGSDIRVLADDVLVFGFDWSPDGSRIAFTEDHGAALRVFVAPADGSTRSLVASLPNNAGNPVWSPDGMQIALGNQNAFLTEDADNLVIDADGSGDPVPIDDLTYESWRGGSYDGADTTTEVGADRSGTFAMLFGEVTFHAARPWDDFWSEPGLFFLGGRPDDWGADSLPVPIIEIRANPLPPVASERACRESSTPPASPASAEELVQAIRSNPDLETTVPVTERVGGIDALRLDVAAVPGASTCPGEDSVSVLSMLQPGGGRVSHGTLGRLHVLDLPGGSARALAILITAREAAFERAVEAAAPVVDSFEFHTG
jgi:dipeptidyl aminopeptidase/acylaminoacyl peptidase